MRRAAGLVLIAVAGFLLGACGGGGGGTSALSTRTGVSVTRTQPDTLSTRTRTAPEGETTTTVTEPTATVTEPTTTADVVTTTTEPEPPPVTTRPPLTVTLAPLPTTTAETTTAVVVAPPPTTTTATETASSSSSTPWGWIALVLALAGVGALIAGIWSRRRSHSSSWDSKRQDLNGRVLAELDEVLERGSVVTGHVQALADEARALEAKAPGGPKKAEAARVRASLDELVRTLETDRTLRLGSPPPTAEQLDYSNALIRQQVDHLQRVLGPRA